MFQKENWKKTIYKEDLICVIVNGLLASILSGILAGVLDFALVCLNVNISVGLFILVYLLGRQMRKGYYSYHILYPVLSIFFLVLGFFFSLFGYFSLYYICEARDFRIYRIFATPSFYRTFLLLPFQNLITGFNGGGALYIILGIINLVIYVWSFVITYRMVKGSN